LDYASLKCEKSLGRRDDLQKQWGVGVRRRGWDEAKNEQVIFCILSLTQKRIEEGTHTNISLSFFFRCATCEVNLVLRLLLTCLTYVNPVKLHTDNRNFFYDASVNTVLTLLFFSLLIHCTFLGKSVYV
jgi:hypothetical protein